MSRLVFAVAAFLGVFTATTPATAQSFKQSIPLSEYLRSSGEMASGGDSTRYFDRSTLSVQRISTDFIPQPIPVDPDDLLMQDALNRADFGTGYAIVSLDRANEPAATYRLFPSIKLDAIYDSRNPGAGAGRTPATIALDGTAAARRTDLFSMATSSVSLKNDLQVPDIAAQGFLDLEANVDAVRIAQAFGRVGNLLGGKYYTMFGDSGTLPQSIITNANPVGAIVQKEQVQLQYVTVFRSGVWLGAAIENPTTDDYTLVAADDLTLSRYPDVVARFRYQPVGTWASFQCAALMRQLGYVDAAAVDHFTTGWGFSTNARFKTFGDSNVRLGFATGQGIGSRMFGLATDVAAGPDAGALEAFHNTGGYLSYQWIWSNTLCSNFAYGYSCADLSPVMPAAATQSTQNGWVNVIANNSSGNVAVGIEYHVGERRARSGAEGIDHTVQFSLQVGKNYVTPGANGAGAESLRSGRDGSRSTAPSGATQAYPRL